MYRKTSSSVYLCILTLIVLFGASGTASAQNGSLIDIISTNEGLSDFNNAIAAAELSWLSNAGPFTVFAPSNQAFSDLPEEAQNVLAENPNELRKLVLYHIIKGDFDTNQLLFQKSHKSLMGQSIKVGFWQGSVYLNDASPIISGDHEANNGHVHIIDKLLLPPNSDLKAAVDAVNGEGEESASPIPSSVPGTPPLAVAYYEIDDPSDNSAFVSGGYRPYWSGIHSSEDDSCFGMTWVTHQISNGHTKIGADRFTNPWRGDTPCGQALPMICILRNDPGHPAPTEEADYGDHWSRATIRATGYIKGTELTSEERANEICNGVFGEGWEMAEFHDAITGSSIRDGWYFWARGGIPTGMRFWVSIFDQPANPWDSSVSRTPHGPVASGGSYFHDPEESNPRFEGWNRIQTPAEGYNAGRDHCKGTTWVLLRQYSDGLTLVGGDSSTNPYVGDRHCDDRYPIICVKVVGYGAPPSTLGNNYTHNWSAAAIQRTPHEYSGIDIGSRREANRICRGHFGNGYRMGTHHDGSLGATGTGGWEFWGFGGGMHAGVRYWIAVNDQRANPWNP